MKLFHFIIPALIILTFTSNAFAKNYYFKKVDATNGINEYEALLIAEKEIKSADFKEYFGSIEPKVRKDAHALKHNEYWFVEFKPDVYTDFMSYLLVVNKETGEIIRSRDYYWPDHRQDLDWVLGKQNRITVN